MGAWHSQGLTDSRTRRVGGLSKYHFLSPRWHGRAARGALRDKKKSTLFQFPISIWRNFEEFRGILEAPSNSAVDLISAEFQKFSKKFWNCGILELKFQNSFLEPYSTYGSKKEFWNFGILKTFLCQKVALSKKRKLRGQFTWSSPANSENPQFEFFPHRTQKKVRKNHFFLDKDTRF